MKRITALFIAAFVLLACEESIKNGIIPPKYLPTAQQYVGDFQGQFDGRQLDLNFSIDATGYATLTVTDLNGNNELIRECPSRIGRMIGVNGDEKKQTLNFARFEFNGRRCLMRGTDLEVHIQDTNHLQLAIIESSHIEYTPGHCYGTPPAVTCDPGRQDEVIDSWMTGSFVRK